MVICSIFILKVQTKTMERNGQPEKVQIRLVCCREKKLMYDYELGYFVTGTFWLVLIDPFPLGKHQLRPKST